MLQKVMIDVKELFSKGREYLWERPQVCFECGSQRIWGHGFVERYFYELGEVFLLSLRRYRCPHCGCVIQMRPAGYFDRFQSSVLEIRKRIGYRLAHGRWLRGLSRSCQGHWVQSLKRHVAAVMGNAWNNRLLEAFDLFVLRGEIPVSRSI